MPIQSGWRDSIDNIIWPTDYCRWDDLGNGSGSYFTITSVGGVALTYGNGLGGGGSTEFLPDNSGYWRINYTDALRLSNRSAWTIDFYLQIDSDSTSTTNFQTAHEGTVFAAGEGGLLTDDGSTRTVDYAGTVDANRKFKFYYNDGSTLNSITSTATISVDDFDDIKIVYDNSEIKIYINNVLDSTTSASAGITNTSNNFVIGGNSTGDYLLSAKVDAFRIRKDAFLTQNVHSQGLGVSTDRQLIEMDPTSDGFDNLAWDVNTLIALFFNEGEGSTAPKPRQLKLIPQTWGDWSYWWVNPKSQIEVTTSTLTFGSPITGFKDVNIATTDGFLCAYGQGQDTLGGATTQFNAWTPTASSSNRHALITDLNPVNELRNDGPFGSGLITTSSTNYSLTLPSAGYLPAEQITESQSLLDTTKVDTLSGNSQYNQGMRPRGIKQITYLINESVAVEELTTDDDQDRRPIMGLPYYEVTDSSSTVYEGGIYSFEGTNITSNRFDFDFRMANSNVVRIVDIYDNNSAGEGVEIRTEEAHGLSDGDKVFVRPGLFREPGHYPNTSGDVNGFDSHRLHGISFVKVTGNLQVELYADSGLTNPINTSTSKTLALHVGGYLIKPDLNGVPYIKDLGHKVVNFANPVADIKETKSNREIIYTPGISRLGAIAGPASVSTPPFPGLPDGRLAEQTVSQYFGGNSGDTVQFKTTPKGDVNDPIEITTFTTGFTGSSLDVCGVFVDLDLPTNGTLYVNISNIERADSSTETPQEIIAFYGLNGHSPTPGTDDLLTTFPLDSADTVSFAISADSEMETDHLRSIQLFLRLQGVTHTSLNDVSRATWKFWFVSSVSPEHNRIFWAGGMPPGFNKFDNPRCDSSSSTNYVSRPRSMIVYKSDGDNSQFEITGIPLIAHSLLGETYISSGSPFEIFRAEGSGDSQHYDLNKVDEAATNTRGGLSDQGPDIAPWVRFASQTKGQYRLYQRRRWECLETHTSSKEFVTDLQLGRWQLI